MSDTKEVLDLVQEEKTLVDVTPKLERFWVFYPHILKLNTLLVGAILAQIVSGFDGSMMNGLQSLVPWQQFFDHPTGGRLGTMSNGVTIGTLIAVPFASLMTDAIGRRFTIIVGCIIIVIGAILQGAAQNFSMFIGARILLGVGGCWASTAAGPLLAECAYPTQRPTVSAFLLASWPLGSFVAALVTWGPYRSDLKTSNWSWRIPSLLQGFFPLLQILLAFLGPESPRYLISKGREDEARAFFTKYHAAGDSEHPVVKFQMAEITAALELEKNDTLSLKNYLAWFKTKAMRHRLFICIVVPAFQQLSGNAIISYYLTLILNSIGITDSLTQLKINIGMTTVSLTADVISAIVVSAYRRRRLFLTGYTSMLLVYIVFTVLSAENQRKNFTDHSLASGVVAMIFVYQIAYHIAAPIAIAYIMEVCPYNQRATGSMLYQLSANVVGTFNNYVNPIAMAAINWRYYIVWICQLVFQISIVYFVFPETAGKDLEDIAEVFGEVGARRAIANSAGLTEKMEAIEHVESV
ncbi:hexose transporter HXT13 [Sugiyamaella lignohabitans]|uniref:Hexose transporter HXT13 n=1 Tax=Sugiyamaella lignohabitans TaxID=796027 RepID=A0A167EWU8_9ASCO|nr:hexose transporter HXT13 [Sugiyamaella lignohabitans]ANB14551.1 hexose transporter HXT13 [Sugiyamaella lignohabitans]